jgi:hypothetical protein
MFANTNIGMLGFVLNFGFPDVCNVPTPAGPIPTPFPNFAMSVTHIPSQYNVIICGGFAENLVTEGTISNGDQAGLALGVISGEIMGPDRYLMGSFTVCIGGVFAMHLTSPTLANGFNTAGLSITPSQLCVLILS